MPFPRLKKLNTNDCLWVYILRILSDKPTHAYLIRNEIQLRFGFRPGIMTAYNVLYLRHRKGFVHKSAEGRKKVYSITPKGRRELVKASKFYKTLAKTLS
jgi:DNA-binding PadR family transcriptional regulator